MENNDEIITETTKETSKMAAFWKKASEVGKSAADGVQKGAVALSEKVKEDSYQHRLKKYNPLFAEEYNDANYVLPHIIAIVDDVVRRGIDVCEGAIGWTDREGDSEVLYLYEESLGIKDIRFYPDAKCGSVYYEDNFNPNRYIRVDCIFGKAHEERLAELENVAHALGAKRCTIEISESKQELMSNSRSLNLGKKIGSMSVDAKSGSSESRSGKITSEFEGNCTPKAPTLKWFSQDDNIKNLIVARCEANNSIKSKTLMLSGSTSATMTQKAAISIDGVLSKLGIKGGKLSMESQAMVEHSSTLIFSVEF